MIDRRRLVGRHDVRLRRLDPRAPLQLGNGRFAVAVDPTGLQTLPDAYPIEPSGTLLGTMSQWGWHSMPNPAGYAIGDASRIYDTPHGPAEYVDLSVHHDAADQSPSDTWLRGNPHRLHLGLVGLVATPPLLAEQLDDIDQHLDLWTGSITSSFRRGRDRWRVTTVVHPERDIVAVSVETSADTRSGIRLRFPYGSEAWGDAADWTRPDAHTTSVRGTGARSVIERRLDDTAYSVSLAVGATEPVIETRDPHEVAVVTTGTFAATVEFAPAPAEPPLDFAEVRAAAADHWAEFWQSGAAVAIAGSDPRATELERRVVLSQYLTAINSAGDVQPAETGLVCNSWRGKWHLEMHWFHVAHFALWGRADVVSRQLAWYESALPAASETARRQRLRGARWPKSVGPSGVETPSNIAPFLIWQQPQPIYLAELVYRAEPTDETLARWSEIVFETAEFMASFPAVTDRGLELGPPVVPAQEAYFPTRATARHPTFEAALWKFGLATACRWFERAGREVPNRWREVAAALAPPTRITVGDREVYAALATDPYLVRDDHPSTLAALGVVPPTSLIDPSVMAASLDDVLADWDWPSTWGWDYPVIAMTATRLGRPDVAIDALLMDADKNEFLANGHNYQAPRLPVYLPGNGSLLSAIALMAAGWDGSPAAPGFPDGWEVDAEGLLPLP